MEHLDSKPDTFLKKDYRTTTGKRQRKALETQRKKEEEERWVAEATEELIMADGFVEQQKQFLKETTEMS